MFDRTDELRADRRFRTELTVVVNTLLDDQTGQVVEISRRGLKLSGIELSRRARICVNYEGQSIQGTVRWSRTGDVIGIALDEPLEAGPLAAVWHRYFKNVEAFGRYPRKPGVVFGRRIV